MPTSSAGRIDDGFSTLLEFSGAPTIKLWTKVVKPPGLSGGGAIETKHMQSTRIRTKKPKSLYDITDAEIKAAYDPAVLDTIVAQLQELQELTLTFADGSTWTFWGWLEEFVPGDCEEGAQPEATIKVMASGEDDSGNEVGIDYGTAP